MTVHQRASRGFLLAVAAIAVGAGLFFYGQALGALLVADCPDFNSPGLSLRCRQPVLYVWCGAGVVLVGTIGLFVALGRYLQRRKSSPRSG